jgi:hypothetical protein
LEVNKKRIIAHPEYINGRTGNSEIIPLEFFRLTCLSEDLLGEQLEDQLGDTLGELIPKTIFTAKDVNTKEKHICSLSAKILMHSILVI